jgi:2,4-dienoyl-CoA reductase (NADPH2)
MRQHTVSTPYQVGDVHFYTTEIRGELVLFDTGPGTPQAFAALQQQVDLDRLQHLFVTHCHDDHFGLAATIAQESDAQIHFPRKDARKLRNLDRRLLRFEAVFSEIGFDSAVTRKLMDWLRKSAWRSDFDQFAIVEESDTLEKLGITWASFAGHSQSDLVYFCGDHAITGDILLRNVLQVPLLDVEVEDFSGRFVNYIPWCTSLAAMPKLRSFILCPGHCGYLELDEALMAYLRRLLKRAEGVRRMAGMQVQEMIVKICGAIPDDPFYLFFKGSELVFLRDFLAEPQRLQEALQQIGLFDSVRDLYAAAVG